MVKLVKVFLTYNYASEACDSDSYFDSILCRPLHLSASLTEEFFAARHRGWTVASVFASTFASIDEILVENAVGIRKFGVLTIFTWKLIGDSHRKLLTSTFSTC
jgi:hypothetical protein